MKVCTECGERYRERIEFCFRDGEILVTAPPRAPRAPAITDPATLALIMQVAAAVTASVAAANPGMPFAGAGSRSR
jgi:hypothetical protein